MTPAERARKIEQLEFERECQQARLRAQTYAEQRRREERRRINAWLGRREMSAQYPTKPGRRGKLYHHNGQSRTLAEWARIANVGTHVFTSRIRSGMDFERALTMRHGTRADMHTINGVSKTLAEWAAYAGIKYMALVARKKTRPLAEAIAMSVPLPTGPGVVLDFAPSEGTGAGSAAQEIPEITFPDSEVSQ